MKLDRRPSFKMTSPVPHHPSPETIMICDYEWSWRTGLKTPSPRAHHPSPETIMLCHEEWSCAAGPPQNDKSNAPSENHNLSLGMKLGRRPSFEMTSPALHHPSPETIIICHYAWSWRIGFKTPSPTPHHPSPETIINCNWRQVQRPIIQVEKQS